MNPVTVHICISVVPLPPPPPMLPSSNVIRDGRGIAIVTGNKFTLLFTQPSNINGMIRCGYIMVLIQVNI